jgi:uncharacterized membrane protein
MIWILFLWIADICFSPTIIFQSFCFRKICTAAKASTISTNQKNVSNKIDYDSIKNDVKHYMGIYWKWINKWSQTSNISRAKNCIKNGALKCNWPPEKNAITIYQAKVFFLLFVYFCFFLHFSNFMPFCNLRSSALGNF